MKLTSLFLVVVAAVAVVPVRADIDWSKVSIAPPGYEYNPKNFTYTDYHNYDAESESESLRKCRKFVEKENPTMTCRAEPCRDPVGKWCWYYDESTEPEARRLDIDLIPADGEYEDEEELEQQPHHLRGAAESRTSDQGITKYLVEKLMNVIRQLGGLNN